MVEIVEARSRDVLRARRRAVRKGDDRAIHALRVATRRLQATLDLFGPCLPARPRRRLARRARNIRRGLGGQRNAWVLFRLVGRLRGLLDPGEKRYAAHLGRRLELSAGSGEKKKRNKIPGVRKRARALQRAMAGRAAPAVAPVHGALATHLEAVRRAGHAARDGDAESMHRLRIAVKRYRYVLEALLDAGAAHLQPAIHEARSLQRELGRLHDLDTLIEVVRGDAQVAGAGAFLRRILRSRTLQAGRALRALAAFRPARLPGNGRVVRERRAERARASLSAAVESGSTAA